MLGGLQIPQVSIHFYIHFSSAWSWERTGDISYIFSAFLKIVENRLVLLKNQSDCDYWEIFMGNLL